MSINNNDEVTALLRLDAAVRVLKYTLQLHPQNKDPRTDQKAYTEVFDSLTAIDKIRGDDYHFDDEAAFKEVMSK